MIEIRLISSDFVAGRHTIGASVLCNRYLLKERHVILKITTYLPIRDKVNVLMFCGAAERLKGWGLVIARYAYRAGLY